MKPQILGIIIIIILAFILLRSHAPSPNSDIKKKEQVVASQADSQKTRDSRKAASLSQMETGPGGKSLLVSSKTQSSWDSFVSKVVQLFTGGGNNSQSGSSSGGQLTVASASTSSSGASSSGSSGTGSSHASLGTYSSGSTSGSGSSSSSGSGSAAGSGDTSSSGSGSSYGTGGSSSGSGSGSSSGGSSGSGGSQTPSEPPPDLVGMPNLEGKSDTELQAEGLYVMENNYMQYIYDTVHSRIIAYDKRVAQEWWAPVDLTNISVSAQKVSQYLIRLTLTERTSTRVWTVNVTMEETAAEVLYEIKASRDMAMRQLVFPPVFQVSDAAEVIAPFAEGLKLPIDVFYQEFPGGIFYEGPKPIPMLGILEGDIGFLQIVETPSDGFWGSKYLSGGRIVLFNQWYSEKGLFGYDRRIRFCLFDQGGYVAMAKRFREYAISKGWLVTLAAKNTARNGNIDKLIGAVDVWYFATGRLRLDFALELKAKGITKVLYSLYDHSSRADLETINNLGYLTSLYDNYHDTFAPEVPDVAYHDGWPDDLVLQENGQPLPGGIVIRNGVQYTGGQLCSIPSLTRARQRISADLVNYPFNARFIDTETAVMWHQCFHPSHPTTKLVDGAYRMQLLNFVSGEKNNVTGSEDGIADAVPFTDYFEGMMSIHAGRLPDSGNHVFAVAYQTPTENFLRYLVGLNYRIPLWELIFHDAVVTTWYWDDSADIIPEYWWKKDLFNILYGNMPLWAIRDHAHWQQYESAFIASYNNVGPVFEKVGYKEMLTHAFLTDDQNVQETTFTGNIRIVVNFGYVDYRLSPSVVVRPHGYVVEENGIVWKTGVCDYSAAIAPNGGG